MLGGTGRRSFAWWAAAESWAESARPAQGLKAEGWRLKSGERCPSFTVDVWRARSASRYPQCGGIYGLTPSHSFSRFIRAPNSENGLM